LTCPAPDPPAQVALPLLVSINHCSSACSGILKRIRVEPASHRRVKSVVRSTVQNTSTVVCLRSGIRQVGAAQCSLGEARRHAVAWKCGQAGVSIILELPPPCESESAVSSSSLQPLPPSGQLTSSVLPRALALPCSPARLRACPPDSLDEDHDDDVELMMSLYVRVHCRRGSRLISIVH
jgi:hypothetical protein